MKLGSHVSFLKDNQLVGSVKEALSYNSNAFMIYTGAPQNSNRQPIDNEKTKEAYKLMIDSNIDLNDVFIHAPYIINMANNRDINMRIFTINFLKQEIKRCEDLGITKLVLHPGSHVGDGLEVGIKNIVDVLNDCINENTKVNICLETMSGKGTECGYRFEQLKEIIDNVKYNKKIMICLDTCHMYDSGYNISDFDSLLDQFDKIIGIEKIACIHLNDSKNNINDKKDRHANIGYGNIGFDNLINVAYNKRLINVPKILETPYIPDNNDSYPPYKYEIDMILNKKFNDKLYENVINYYKNNK